MMIIFYQFIFVPMKLTKTEKIILEKLLDISYDSDFFDGEHLPKGCKDTSDVNKKIDSIRKKLNLE